MNNKINVNNHIKGGRNKQNETKFFYYCLRSGKSTNL